MKVILNLTTEYMTGAVGAYWPGKSPETLLPMVERWQRDYVRQVEKAVKGLSRSDYAETQLSVPGLVYPDRKKLRGSEVSAYSIARNYAYRKYVGHVVGYSTSPLSDPENRLILHMSNGDRLTVYSEVEDLVY